MLTGCKSALAGGVLLAALLPATGQAQTYYVNSGWAPGYDDGWTYDRGYDWGPGPFWPVAAAAGIVGGAANLAANIVTAPFVGWRDGYWVDERIDPIGYDYGWGETYTYGAPAYAPAPVSRTAYYRTPGYVGGYVATYRGKAHQRHQAAMHVSMQSHGSMVKHKTRHHMAQR